MSLRVLVYCRPYFVIFLLLCCIQAVSHAQNRFEGIVVSQENGEALEGISVKIAGTSEGTSTNSSGRFRVASGLNSITVELSGIGYVTENIKISEGEFVTIELRADDQLIDEVAVTAKVKYSNRNNPAVELIDQVIKNKNRNRLSGKEKIQFKQYEKLKLGLVDTKPFVKSAFGSINYMFDNMDTTTIPGHDLLLIYLEENQSEIYSQKSPKRFKKLVKQQQKTDLDPRYINNPNIQSYFNYVFQPVDIYDESVFLVNKLFLSPIADNGKVFYKYYISDTINSDAGRYVKLNFVPRNKEDLLFRGTLMVAIDGNYAVKSSHLHIGKAPNVNWLNYADVDLSYSPNADNIMLLDTAKVSLSLGSRNQEAAYGEKISVNYDYDLSSEIEDGVFAGEPIEIRETVDSIVNNRPLALTQSEATTYHNIVRLNEDRNFKAALSLGYLLAQSYYNLNKFELGPLEYLYSWNNIEGNRFRLGGRSTPLLTDKVFLEGYLAYGNLDRQFKYYLSSAFSLNGSSVATYPAHYIEATVQHDILDPGRQMSFLRGDSFFMSLRRNRPTKWFDTDAYQLKHLIEFGNHVSVATGFNHTRRSTIGDFRLRSSADPSLAVRDLNTSEFQLTLRWAPYEKFYYRNLTRSTVVEKYPVFTVDYAKGVEGIFGSQFDYDKLSASVSKRLFLNQIGFTDLTLTGGKIWGTLPYTLLYMPNVKQKVDRHDIDYDLMNSLEFAADEYVKLGMYHQFNGFVFNKIPFLKRLRLREVLGAQMFYGKLSPRNDPRFSDHVVEFDTDVDGNPLTQGLGTVPYWEGSIGIDNILRILKVEYVRRLTHTNFPNISQDRVRVSISINF